MKIPSAILYSAQRSHRIYVFVILRRKLYLIVVVAFVNFCCNHFLLDCITASPDFIIFCKITEPLSVQTFRKSTKYGFMGTCEHVAVSSCLPIAGFDIQVTVDFITESMEIGAVGLHVNDLRYVSREDGSFDDGSQTPQSSTSTHREYLLDPGVEVIVDFGLGVTNITFDTGTKISGDSFDLDIQIVHIYGNNETQVLK